MADWAGAFGDEYTERNTEIPSRRAFWEDVIPEDAGSALEIGCNSGANLEAIDFIPAFGCDVNKLAIEKAREKGLDATVCHGFAMTRRADFVFTCGVLIHLQTADIIKMMRKMRELSDRYVCCNEYFSERDLEVPYRDQPGALYKRNFYEIYRALFPKDTLERVTTATKEEGFDNTTCWVWRKE